MSTGLPNGRNMWIRAFYGLNPEEAGYVGWTMESGQARALRELKDGDLMMIYGVSSGNTMKAMRSGGGGANVQGQARKAGKSRRRILLG